MLDVHAPHQAARGWRDFFVHITTIAVGLLIAIGLEQVVESIHHMHQVRDAREALALEREANRHEFARTTEMFRRETARFQANLAVFQYLQQHPGAPPQTWPGKVNWHNWITDFSATAWQTAQQSGVTALMPQPEVRAAEGLYRNLGIVQASKADRLHAITAARRYMTLDADPSRLTSTQLTEEVDLAEAVLVAHYRFGGDMRNIHSLYGDFAPAPETDELRAIVHEGPATVEEKRELTPSSLSSRE